MGNINGSQSGEFRRFDRSVKAEISFALKWISTDTFGSGAIDLCVCG